MRHEVAGISIALGLVAACNKSSDEKKPTLNTSTVPCLVPAGTTTTPSEVPLSFNVVGASWCNWALSNFFNANPEARIISIVPVEYPTREVTPEREIRGTRDLVVLHADRGPWPRAGSLTIVTTPCYDGGKYSAAGCAMTMEEYFIFPLTRFVVPLTDFRRSPKVEPGTNSLLMIRDK